MFNKVDAKLLESLRKISTGTLGHFLTEGFLDWKIQPLFRPVKLVGQAITVACPPTDNTVLTKAIESCERGDVLVIYRYGDLRHAAWGGILSRVAQQRGIAGVVIDGAATDWKEINDIRFPVFCRHLSALTTRRKNEGGVIGQPVTCGGLTIHSGDIILGDEDGLVAISPHRLDSVIEQGLAKEEAEGRLREDLKKSGTAVDGPPLNYS